MKSVYFVSGDKGGVGKSWVSSALVHVLSENGAGVHIVETDSGNPDVYAPYVTASREGVTGIGVDLDSADGWLALIDTVEALPDGTAIVINHGARGLMGAVEHGAVFFNNISALGVSLKALWVINCEKDGLVALKNFMQVCGNAQVFVVMNGFFGAQSKFSQYLESSLRKSVLDGGGQELFFPVLPERVASKMRNERKHFGALDDLPISNRLASKTFLDTVAERFSAAGV